jgi:hypothetical protein
MASIREMSKRVRLSCWPPVPARCGWKGDTVDKSTSPIMNDILESVPLCSNSTLIQAVLDAIQSGSRSDLLSANQTSGSKPDLQAAVGRADLLPDAPGLGS